MPGTGTGAVPARQPQAVGRRAGPAAPARRCAGQGAVAALRRGQSGHVVLSGVCGHSGGHWGSVGGYPLYPTLHAGLPAGGDHGCGQAPAGPARVGYGTAVGRSGAFQVDRQAAARRGAAGGGSVGNRAGAGRLVHRGIGHAGAFWRAPRLWPGPVCHQGQYPCAAKARSPGGSQAGSPQA